MVNYPNEIGRVIYGSIGQFRSSIMNIGIKKLYLVDLPRAKGSQDKPQELCYIGKNQEEGSKKQNKMLIMEQIELC